MIDISLIIKLFSTYKPWLVLLFALFVWIIPLHFAVKFVGGDTHLFKSLGYAILSAFWHLISILILSLVKIGEYGILIGFLISAWYYANRFNVGFFRGGLILLLQYLFGAIVSFITDFFNIISVKEALINLGVKI